MHHLDEHTLAFYAMGSDSIEPEREMIEAHLRECHGCRTQLEELRAVNAHMVEVAGSPVEADGAATEALISFPRALRRRPDTRPPRFEGYLPSRASRFLTMVRSHPMGSGSAVFVLALLGIMLVRGVGNRPELAEQPASVRLNALGTALDVLGAKSTRLWEIPISIDAASQVEREIASIHCIAIADLDGDGSMEVIAGAPFRQREEVIKNVLRVYDRSGEIINTRTLGIPSAFGESAYANSFTINGVAAVSRHGSTKKDILVGMINDRSPSCLVRLDHRGETVGEYWHFGWLHGPKRVQMDGGPEDLVLMYGVNDVDYLVDSVFPAAAILDVSKIEGRTESVKTRGFGYAPSRAEVYYIKAGDGNPALISTTELHRASFTRAIKFSSDSSFTLCAKHLEPEGFPLAFYTFGKDLAIRSVWLTDSHDIALAKNFLVNKTAAGMMEYRRDLESNVRYWDGTEWQREPTPISLDNMPDNRTVL